MEMVIVVRGKIDEDECRAKEEIYKFTLVKLVF